MTKVFEPEEIGLFLDTCGDSNPLHIDFEAAEEAGESLFGLTSVECQRSWFWRQTLYPYEQGSLALYCPGYYVPRCFLA